MWNRATRRHEILRTMRRIARRIPDRLDGAATSRGSLSWLSRKLPIGDEILRTMWPDVVDLETGAIKTGSSPFVTEPRAVATGLLSCADFFNNHRAGRYRSRFCNDRLLFLQPTLTFNHTLRFALCPFALCPLLFAPCSFTLRDHAARRRHPWAKRGG